MSKKASGAQNAKKQQPAMAPRPATNAAASGRLSDPTPAWFTAFLVLLALMPLPFGSNRPWAGDLFALSSGFLLLWMLSSQKPSQLWAGDLPRNRLRAAAGLFTAVILWAFVQVSPFTPSSWHHPIWSEAAPVLGSVSGTIAVDPGAFPEALLRLMGYIAFFLLAFVGGRYEKGAKQMLKTMAFAGAGYALYGLIIQSTGSETILWFKKWAYYGFVTSTFVNKNSYAAYAGLGLLCALGLVWRKISRVEIKDKVLARQSQAAAFFASLELKHYAFAALPLIILAALVLSGSRAGIASALAGAMALFLSLAINKRLSAGKWLTLVVVFFGFFVLLVALGGDALTARMDGSKLDHDAGERLAGYALALQAIGDNPWLGFGLGSFEGAFRLYRDATLPVWFHHAHNDYLELAMDLGLPAASLLLTALAILVSCCLQGIWKRKRAAIFPALAIGASVLLMIHAFMDFSLQIPAISASYAALLGLGVAQSWSTRAQKKD